jgi:hypothetical protein
MVRHSAHALIRRHSPSKDGRLFDALSSYLLPEGEGNPPSPAGSSRIHEARRPPRRKPEKALPHAAKLSHDKLENAPLVEMSESGGVERRVALPPPGFGPIIHSRPG